MDVRFLFVKTFFFYKLSKFAFRIFYEFSEIGTERCYTVLNYCVQMYYVYGDAKLCVAYPVPSLRLMTCGKWRNAGCL